MYSNIPVLVIVSLTALLGIANGECPNGWIHNGQSCYWVSHDKESWIGAFKVCGFFKAFLVEIENEAENIFVFNLTTPIRDSFWLGGTDLGVEGEWLWWNSQTDLGYTAWADNEPSNSNFDENCLETTTRGWNDNRCSGSIHYVCERPFAPTQSVLGR